MAIWLFGRSKLTVYNDRVAWKDDQRAPDIELYGLLTSYVVFSPESSVQNFEGQQDLGHSLHCEGEVYQTICTYGGRLCL